jgi:hypothetical protein
MNELTLESLAKRVEALEEKIAKDAPSKDWRSAIGRLGDSEMMQIVLDEGQAIREREREKARREESKE